jgi:hypothetical protein
LVLFNFYAFKLKPLLVQIGDIGNRCAETWVVALLKFEWVIRHSGYVFSCPIPNPAEVLAAGRDREQAPRGVAIDGLGRVKGPLRRASPAPIRHTPPQSIHSKFKRCVNSNRFNLFGSDYSLLAVCQQQLPLRYPLGGVAHLVTRVAGL